MIIKNFEGKYNPVLCLLQEKTNNKPCENGKFLIISLLIQRKVVYLQNQ